MWNKRYAGRGAIDAPVASPPAPTLPTSLLFAYDPSASGTLFSDIAGTTPAAVNGPVGYMANVSGSAGPAIAKANDATRPTLRTGGGLYWLEYAGGQGLYATISVTSATLHAAVAVQTPQSNEKRILSLGANNTADWGSTNYASLIQTTDFLGYKFWCYRNGDLGRSPVYTANTNCVVECVFNGTNHTMYLNGTGGSAEASTANFNATQIAIGCGTDVWNFWTGHFFGGVAAARAFDSSDRTLVRDWCDERAGL